MLLVSSYKLKGAICSWCTVLLQMSPCSFILFFLSLSWSACNPTIHFCREACLWVYTCVNFKAQKINSASTEDPQMLHAVEWFKILIRWFNSAMMTSIVTKKWTISPLSSFVKCTISFQEYSATSQLGDMKQGEPTIETQANILASCLLTSLHFSVTKSRRMHWKHSHSN